MLEFILTYISVQNLMWLIVLLPLIGFVVNGLVALCSNVYKLDEPRAFSISFSLIVVLFSFIGVIILWYILYGLEESSPSVITGALFSCKGLLNRPIEFGLKADQLSLVIAFIISFVGLLTHLYSVGFMAAEKKVSFYLSMFNLVLSLALLLVFTDSFFIFFAVWQVMAVIGFVSISRYFSDSEGIKSASTYYVIEAIAGSALLLVMFLIWKAFAGQPNLDRDIFQFASIQAGAPYLLPYATVICLALLVSVLARSMQFPLYIWMTGATKAFIPVFTFTYAVCSVLVSAYILIRLNFLLVLSPKVLNLIAALGGVGCLYGAISAIVQKEAKKVISYFVISQIGLAFVGIGVGAFATSLFHVFTHAIYVSSLLFGIGSVIAITGSDSFGEVAGLRKSLPVTFWTTLVGTMAAVGIYPLAGFFGKNGIIWEAYQRGHGVLFLCTFLSVILIAIALFRMIAMIFFGKKSSSAIGTRKLEESSVSMLVAMVVVAFASIVIGWFGVSKAFGGADHFRVWLEPGLATQMVHMIGEKGKFSELVLAVIVTLFVAHAGLVTWIICVHKKKWTIQLAERFPKINHVLENGLYLNSFYEHVVIRPLAFFNEWVLWKGVDRLFVGGVVVSSVGRGIKLFGDVVTRFKVVDLSGYIFWVVVGLVVLLSWLIF